jgi:hypothetical protein
MVRGLVLLFILPLLSACAVAHVAGNVVEGTVKTTGAVIGGAADAVTTSDEEKAAKAHKDD